MCGEIADSSNTVILAYHWKNKSKKSDASTIYIDEFSKLIKMEHQKTNWKIILMYIIVAAVLGIIGDYLYDMLKVIFSEISEFAKKI